MKKIGRGFLIIVLVCVIVGVGYAAAPDVIVYVTKTGEKYHTVNCSSVRNSKIEIPLGEAVSRGYEPCKRCEPPVLDVAE